MRKRIQHENPGTELTQALGRAGLEREEHILCSDMETMINGVAGMSTGAKGEKWESKLMQMCLTQ